MVLSPNMHEVRSSCSGDRLEEGKRNPDVLYRVVTTCRETASDEPSIQFVGRCSGAFVRRTAPQFPGIYCQAGTDPYCRGWAQVAHHSLNVLDVPLVPGLSAMVPRMTWERQLRQPTFLRGMRTVCPHVEGACRMSAICHKTTLGWSMLKEPR